MTAVYKGFLKGYREVATIAGVYWYSTMNNVVSHQNALRGQFGRIRVNPSLITPFAAKSPESAVEAVVEAVLDLHEVNCICTLWDDIHRCAILERRLKVALGALARGATPDQAIQVAGPYGSMAVAQ